MNYLLQVDADVWVVEVTDRTYPLFRQYMLRFFFSFFCLDFVRL